MSKPMIFPWINRQELEKVYKELYSGSVIKQKHALGRVSVWKSRAVHKLPVAVESTAAFVSANLECRRAGTAKGEDLRLRRLCSFALMRFVNHITEKRQSATFAQPIHRLAAELGVPEWIVDLRHEATHGELPSLCVLRVALNWCLHWLKVEFWERQIASATDEVDSGDGDDSDVVRDILVTYQQQAFMRLSKKDYHDNGNLDKDIERILHEKGSAVCSTLTEEGYLIFTDSQLASLNVTQEEILNGDLLLPAKIMKFWKLLLRILVNSGLMLELMFLLLAKITEERSLANKFRIGWIYTILWHNLRASKAKASLFKSQHEVPYKQLLDLCAQKPNPFSVPLIELLLNQVDNQVLTEERKEILRQLMTVYFNNSSVSDQIENIGQTRTVTDIVRESEKVPSGRWSRCTESVDWSKHALGVLPNQVLDYKCLELSNGEEDDNSDSECMVEDDSVSNTMIDEPYSFAGQLGTSQWSESAIDFITSSVIQEVVALEDGGC